MTRRVASVLFALFSIGPLAFSPTSATARSSVNLLLCSTAGVGQTIDIPLPSAPGDGEQRSCVKACHAFGPRKRSLAHS